jgi:hypothetical protein
VWHLGDFAYRATADAVSALLRRLNGSKHLIAGNNDGPATLAAPEWARCTVVGEGGAARLLPIPILRRALRRTERRRGWPGRARPRGSWVVLGFPETTDFAQPDSCGLVPAIHDLREPIVEVGPVGVSTLITVTSCGMSAWA